MNKKELEQKLVEVDAQLKALGDLNILIQKSSGLPGIIADIEAKRNTIAPFVNDLPLQKTKLNEILSEVGVLKSQLSAGNENVTNLTAKTEELQKKVVDLIDQTKVQLGVAANAKLASTFEQVKSDLIKEKIKFFNWLVGVVVCLVLVTGLIVVWQIYDVGTLYHLSFPIRIALVSPIIYFVVFINREYNRVKHLIEEYTFKAAIARSFEAYREIVQDADSEESEKTLAFILKSITDLYSSPMVNIKNNIRKEQEDVPDILSTTNDILNKTKS